MDGIGLQLPDGKQELKLHATNGKVKALYASRYHSVDPRLSPHGITKRGGGVCSRVTLALRARRQASKAQGYLFWG